MAGGRTKGKGWYGAHAGLRPSTSRQSERTQAVDSKCATVRALVLCSLVAVDVVVYQWCCCGAFPARAAEVCDDAPGTWDRRGRDAGSGRQARWRCGPRTPGHHTRTLEREGAHDTDTHDTTRKYGG